MLLLELVALWLSLELVLVLVPCEGPKLSPGMDPAAAKPGDDGGCPGSGSGVSESVFSDGKGGAVESRSGENRNISE